HPTKRRGDLHQPAELDLLGEIARRRNQERKYRRHLLVAVGEPAQLLAPKDDVPPIRDNISEALVEDLSLSPLTAIEGDAFGIFTQPHQAETKIGFVALLVVCQPHQWMTDPAGQEGADDGINDR